MSIEIVSSAEKTREFYRRQGEKREQERIIKLIDAYAMKDLTLELDKPLKESLAFVANTYSNIGHDFGVQDEQQRIIKLIEEDCSCIMPRSEYYFGCRSHLLIALIKGENK